MKPFRENYHHTKDQCVGTRDYKNGERITETKDRKTGATTGFKRSTWSKKGN